MSVSGHHTLSADGPTVTAVPAGDLYVTLSHSKAVSLHAPPPLLFNTFGPVTSTRSQESDSYADAIERSSELYQFLVDRAHRRMRLRRRVASGGPLHPHSGASGSSLRSVSGHFYNGSFVSEPDQSVTSFTRTRSRNPTVWGVSICSPRFRHLLHPREYEAEQRRRGRLAVCAHCQANVDTAGRRPSRGRTSCLEYESAETIFAPQATFHVSFMLNRRTEMGINKDQNILCWLYALKFSDFP
jgi:hypothetical protein